MESSPHLQKYNPDAKPASSFSRILNPRSRRKKYEKLTSTKDHMHNGQRKLLLTEIEFITREFEKLKKGHKIVLYIGASTGATKSIHTYTLAQMFPEFEYHLYDDKSFYHKLRELKNVKIFQRWFTDEDSKRYKGKNVLMISDMRDPIIGKHKNNNNLNKQNKTVFDDMAVQRKFYEDIQPISALLKFRLPWKPGKTEYLDGDIYYQLWQGLHSTETRLVPNGKLKVYDNTSYEERLFYFNTETRFKYYKHDIECYGHCYDCNSEITILENYIKFRNLKISVCDLGKEITKELSFYNERRLFPHPPLNYYDI